MPAIALPPELDPRLRWLLAQLAAAAGLAIGPGPLLTPPDEWHLEGAFGVLARLEELAGAKDEHGRFPASASSLASADTPIDDLVLQLREAASSLGVEPHDRWEGGARFAVALTHDIDTPWRWSRRGVLGAGARAKRAVQGGRLREAARETAGLTLAPVHRVRGSDPNWSHGRFAKLEARHGFRSTSFVIAQHLDAHDGAAPAEYTARRAALVRELRELGEVGLHASYTAGADERQLADERAILQGLGAQIEGNRHHYLRLAWHEGIRALDRCGFLYDTTLGYAERPGARAGLSFPFHPWDVAAGAPLRIVEIPLVLMDATLAEDRYLALSPSEAWPVIEAQLDHLARVGGCAAVLWHNDRFDRVYGRGWDRVYRRLLDGIVERGGTAAPAADLARYWIACRASS